jgi:hypothetical protein
MQKYVFKNPIYAEAVLKFAKLNTESATTWSVCSRAKPTAHTGFGIVIFADYANNYCYKKYNTQPTQSYPPINFTTPIFIHPQNKLNNLSEIKE